MTFDEYYPSNPWENIDKNKRAWYNPDLSAAYYRDSVLAPFIQDELQMTAGDGVPATEITVTSSLPPHPNIDPVGMYQMWLPSMGMDSFERKIAVQHYAGKMSFHKYDQMITYWRQNGRLGLSNIIEKAIGENIVQVLERLAVKALLANPAKYYCGGATDFAGLDAHDAHQLKVDDIFNIRLGIDGKQPELIVNSAPLATGNPIVCVTTPGVIIDLMRYAEENGYTFTEVTKYTNTLPFNGEIGTFMNIRWISNPRNILFSNGEITAQATVVSPISSGQGAAAGAIAGARYVGQDGSTRYLQLDTGEAAGFSVNDVVAIHATRTDAMGVTNGVNHSEGKLHYRTIASVDVANDRIAFTLPVMEDFKDEVDTGVYAYVTLGTHIHASFFFSANNAIMRGTSQPIMVQNPDPVDDLRAMYRVAWDGYFGYALWNPESYEVAFSRGSYRNYGSVVK
jgi:N4-gp56 family major capsid protein